MRNGAINEGRVSEIWKVRERADAGVVNYTMQIIKEGKGKKKEEGKRRRVTKTGEEQ